VDELEDSGDLRLLIKTYLQSLSGVPINSIVDFYQNVRQRASKSLADGTGRRPHFRLVCSLFRLFVISSFYRDNELRWQFLDFLLAYNYNLQLSCILLCDFT